MGWKAKSDLKLSYYAKYLDIYDKCNIKYQWKAHILIFFVSYNIKFKLTFDYIKTIYGYKTLFGIEPLEIDEIQQQIYNEVYS